MGVQAVERAAFFVEKDRVWEVEGTKNQIVGKV